MARLSFERRALLRRAAESLVVAYDELQEMQPDDVQAFLYGGDITVAAVAFVTGLEEEEIIAEVVKQAKKRNKPEN